MGILRNVSGWGGPQHETARVPPPWTAKSVLTVAALMGVGGWQWLTGDSQRGTLSFLAPYLPILMTAGASYIGGFLRSDNLMLTYLSDESWIPRENLSLGQLFRINVDTRSWINVAGAVRGPTQSIDPSGLACQCNPYENKPCPRLSLDIANVSNDIQSVGCP